MEYMDRRGRSLLVQFWLTVETFKNPLESVDSDTSSDEGDILSDLNSSKTLQEDMVLVNDLYFSGPTIPPVLSSISSKHIETIRSYAAQPAREAYHQKKVRRSVMLAQREVEQAMEGDFEDFRRSDLWFRVIADLAPKMEDIRTPDATITAPSSRQSSSTGLLATITKTLTHELSRPSPNVSNSHLPTSPVLGSGAGPSRQPVPTRVPSNPQTQQNLEFLMSPSTESGGGSRAPLFDEADDGTLVSTDADEAKRMDAIQAAVTDILATENQQDARSSMNRQSSEQSSEQGTGGHSTVSMGERRAMFEDSEDNPFDEQAIDDDELGPSTFQMPAPGDLQLSEDIARLADKISHMQSQDVILDTLIRKAELTGDTQELKLLRRSKSALEREMRQLTFQKTQYEQQESVNKLVPGKTKASIVNSTVGEEDGKSVVRYLIEVQQLGPNGEHSSGWVVARRYNEFFVMHQRLRERYIVVKNLEFPGKRLVTTLSSSLVDNRRIALEKYLQASPYLKSGSRCPLLMMCHNRIF